MDNREIVLATNDLSFKKLFATSENSDILIGFINDFYDLNVKQVIIENPYSIEEFNRVFSEVGYFETEVDTICTTEDNSKFTIEMQVRNLGCYIERTTYYLCNRYCSSYNNPNLIKENKSKYSSLCPTYAINILNYNQFKDDKSIHKFNLYDLDNKMYLRNDNEKDILSLGFFELKKEDKEISQNMKYWKEFFQTGRVSEDAPEYIRKASKKVFINSFNKEERVMIDQIEKIKEDNKAREDFVKDMSKKEGIGLGKIEGKIEAQKDFVSSLLKDNISIEKIEKYTGLTTKEINDLIKKL